MLFKIILVGPLRLIIRDILILQGLRYRYILFILLYLNLLQLNRLLLQHLIWLLLRRQLLDRRTKPLDDVLMLLKIIR